MPQRDDLGLSIDMLDVDRLREWARLLLLHGSDIGHWGSVPYVAGKMQIIATGIEKAVKDIGELRASSAEAGRVSRRLGVIRDEMTNALGNGAFFNPVEFTAVFQNGDNAILRWRDELSALLASVRPETQRVYWKLVEDPTWKPYCLACRSMQRMVRRGDTFSCVECGMLVGLDMAAIVTLESPIARPETQEQETEKEKKGDTRVGESQPHAPGVQSRGEILELSDSPLPPQRPEPLEELLRHLTERRQGNGMSCLHYTPQDGNEYGYGSCKLCGWAEPEHVIDRLWVAVTKLQSWPLVRRDEGQETTDRRRMWETE